MKKLVAVGLGATVLALGAGALFGAASAAPATGRISIVQAVPGQQVGVTVGGRKVESAAAVGAVLGPFDLPVGQQQVTFTSGGNQIHTQVDVRSGDSSDVVLHLPARSAGAPVINTYRVPLGPIGVNKSRVLLAHAATVGAVDIAVNGRTTFRDVANGQFAKADVPAGDYQVALDGVADKALHADFDVPLAASTLSMVFAYEQGGKMKTIVDSRRLASNGVTAPTRIHTGSAGLASGGVSSFGDSSGSGPTVSEGLLTLGVVLLIGLVTPGLRRTPAVVVARRDR